MMTRNPTRLCPLVMVGLLLLSASANATEKCGAVCDETWTLAGNPYVVTCDVTLAAGCTLMVDAAVEVRFQAGATLEVSGMLDVNGTSGSEVLFTSDAAVPSVGDWAGLQMSGGSGTLEYARVSYATNGISVLDSPSSAVLRNVTVTDNTSGVYVYRDATATLTDVTARGNVDGLFVHNGAPQVDVSGGSFTDNTNSGVRVNGGNDQPGASVTVTGAELHGNGSYDLIAALYANPSSTIVWAPDNWWGTTNHDVIRERIYDHEDSSSSPLVYFKPFGDSCEIALCADVDRDGRGDFADNCPVDHNTAQADTDADGMGDPCDPDPGVQPAGPCDGVSDTFDGYADADSDGWGDPCDFQPTRDDSYPGAPELCDGRDNDGDGAFLLGELIDFDFDQAIECSDCDDAEPEVYPCACESCINLREDDCDGLMDRADPECFENPYCVVVTANMPDPFIRVDKGVCGGANLSGPFDVIRGQVSQLQLSGGSVDLGNVHCVAGSLDWDRVTDVSTDPNPECNDTTLYFLARDSGVGDFGSAYPGSEPRDVMNPDPACP